MAPSGIGGPVKRCRAIGACYAEHVWFVYVVAALVLVAVGGLYVRRRLTGALAHFGVSGRRTRIMRWVLAWLLFGFPIIVIVSITVSRLLGRATIPRFDGMFAGWLLGVPFVWTLLVVVQTLPWLVVLELVHVIVRRRRGVAMAVRVRSIGVLAVVGVFAIYTPLRIVAERGDLRVRHHRIERAGSGTAGPPFRIGFIADVQQDVHTDGERAREVYARVNASHPDLVLSGGDWINTGPDYIEEAAAAAGTLKSRLGTFSVIGDHEHFAYVDRERSVAEVERAMRRHGVAMLNNEVRWFQHGGKRIAVVFLNYNYMHRTDPATIAVLVASVAAADYSIVVTHQLDDRLAALLENQVDLVLAGHTHGGQVNPVLGVMHVNLARLETPYVDGRYQRGETTILVTAGIGTSIVPIRYAAPSSIELIELAL